MANLNNEQLRRLARLGAISRLEQLQQEEAGIRAEFPELFGRGNARTRASAAAAAREGGGRRRGRRKMSAAARKAVSDRMRKYWAERRKAKGAK